MSFTLKPKQEFGKFNYKLSDFNYILGFDLATYKTGACLFDCRKQCFIDLREIEVEQKTINKHISLFERLHEYFNFLSLIAHGKILVIKEACPLQSGPFTTISTLQSLGASHAVLDICMGGSYKGIELIPYDNIGIYAVGVKALFRTKQNTKPQKEDIRKELVNIYNLDDSILTDNISDSVGVIHTLINRKWNRDIEAQVRELRKETKQLKMQNAISRRQEEIERLSALKIVEKGV